MASAVPHPLFARPALAGSCHSGRDTATAIERAGFALAQVDRSRFTNPDLSAPYQQRSSSQHQ